MSSALCLLASSTRGSCGPLLLLSILLMFSRNSEQSLPVGSPPFRLEYRYGHTVLILSQGSSPLDGRAIYPGLIRGLSMKRKSQENRPTRHNNRYRRLRFDEHLICVSWSHTIRSIEQFEFSRCQEDSCTVHACDSRMCHHKATEVCCASKQRTGNLLFKNTSARLSSYRCYILELYLLKVGCASMVPLGRWYSGSI